MQLGDTMILGLDNTDWRRGEEGEPGIPFSSDSFSK